MLFPNTIPASNRVQPLLGFTLIELLITVSIMLLLIAGAIAGYIRFSERQRAEAYAREVHQLYRIAQSKATAREVPAGYLNGNTTCNNNDEATRLRGYEVIRTNTTFSVEAVCGPSNVVAGLRRSGQAVRTVTSTNLPNTTATTTLPERVIFYTIPSPRETNLTDVQTVTINSQGRQFVFSISPAGAVSTIARTTP